MAIYSPAGFLLRSIISIRAETRTWGIQGMAINPCGTIAGYYQDLSGTFHAFLLDC